MIKRRFRLSLFESKVKKNTRARLSEIFASNCAGQIFSATDNNSTSLSSRMLNFIIQHKSTDSKSFRFATLFLLLIDLSRFFRAQKHFYFALAISTNIFLFFFLPLHVSLSLSLYRLERCRDLVYFHRARF